MEIKRKINMSVVTNRRFIIRQMKNTNKVFCKICGEPMLTAEQTAEFLDIKQRLIFQLIEQEKVHFTEIEPQAVMICLSSMSSVLKQDLLSLNAKNK
jgi:hypothetical protein